MKRNIYMLVMLIFCVAGAAFTIQYKLRADQKGPEIRIPEEDITYHAGENTSVLLQGVTAVDDRDGDVTSSLVIEDIYLVDNEHYAKITYVAMDSKYNVSKEQRVVRYEAASTPQEEETEEETEPETTEAAAETSGAVELPEPGEIRVAVVNASGRDGAAGQQKAELQEAGFARVQAGNASAEIPVTTICSNRPEVLELMLTYFPGAVTAEEMPEENVDVDLTDVDVCVLLGQE